jgi:hypothetical protein
MSKSIYLSLNIGFMLSRLFQQYLCDILRQVKICEPAGQIGFMSDRLAIFAVAAGWILGANILN